MSFFYFTPGIANAADYQRLGLDYAFSQPPNVTQIDNRSGPDGLAGTVLHGWVGPQLPVALHWYKARDDLWVGYSPHARPTPTNLRRAVELSVYTSVGLADGNYWSVPRLLVCTQRDPHRTDGLPRVISGQGADGEPQMKIPDEYEPLIERAGRFLAAWEGEGTGALPSGESLGFAAQVLGVGYRLTADELLALELLTPGNCETVCMDAIDALERLLASAPPPIGDRLDEAGLVSWGHLRALGARQFERERADQPLDTDTPSQGQEGG